jgi:hypothetical protein
MRCQLDGFPTQLGRLGYGCAFCRMLVVVTTGAWVNLQPGARMTFVKLVTHSDPGRERYVYVNPAQVAWYHANETGDTTLHMLAGEKIHIAALVEAVNGRLEGRETDLRSRGPTEIPTISPQMDARA